jgi:hypothetical protein
LHHHHWLAQPCSSSIHNIISSSADKIKVGRYDADNDIQILAELKKKNGSKNG